MPWPHFRALDGYTQVQPWFKPCVPPCPVEWTLPDEEGGQPCRVLTASLKALALLAFVRWICLTQWPNSAAWGVLMMSQICGRPFHWHVTCHCVIVVYCVSCLSTCCPRQDVEQVERRYAIWVKWQQCLCLRPLELSRNDVGLVYTYFVPTGTAFSGTTPEKVSSCS